MDTDLAAHKTLAATVTERTLARPLPADHCYAVTNVYGEREGFMPLVQDDLSPMTSRDLAAKTIAALVSAHAHSLVSPRLVVAPIDRVLAWLAAY